ncbi:HAMP domain-containing protein [Methylobacterium sp. WL119]|nr:HAMP domain-containing protein [Methylobacterium sp. WL93]TXN44174.1 HAMP domain-containing protein [Methylobacterium sp. WL119]
MDPGCCPPDVRRTAGSAEPSRAVRGWPGTSPRTRPRTVCIGIGIAINRVIVRPLGRVMTFVEQVGQGDLSGTLGDGAHNEIGRLGCRARSPASILFRIIGHAWAVVAAKHNVRWRLIEETSWGERKARNLTYIFTFH